MPQIFSNWMDGFQDCKNGQISTNHNFQISEKHNSIEKDHIARDKNNLKYNDESVKCIAPRQKRILTVTWNSPDSCTSTAK